MAKKDFDIKDIFEAIEDIVEKISKDKDLKETFEKNPAKAIESIIGIDLPDDKVNDVVDAVKAKLTLDTVGDILGGLGGLFKK
ncbi:MAG: hypothetical protein IKT62_01725 [Firmicutes bacterium]|nr:hypothetical protein [Bacillota bacterium]